MGNEIKLIRELLEKDIHYLKQSSTAIENHLCNLNGQVAKNTSFRHKAVWTGSIIIFLLSLAGTTVGRFLF